MFLDMKRSYVQNRSTEQNPMDGLLSVGGKDTVFTVETYFLSLLTDMITSDD